MHIEQLKNIAARLRVADDTRPADTELNLAAMLKTMYTFDLKLEAFALEIITNEEVARFYVNTKRSIWTSSDEGSQDAYVAQIVRAMKMIDWLQRLDVIRASAASDLSKSTADELYTEMSSDLADIMEATPEINVLVKVPEAK